jgi:hypothetical protein
MLSSNVEESFKKHLDVIKVAFYHPKKLVDNDTWVLEVLLVASFDMQQSMFKLAMKSNACTTMVKSFDVNPLTWFCTLFRHLDYLLMHFLSTSSWLKLPLYECLVV